MQDSDVPRMSMKRMRNLVFSEELRSSRHHNSLNQSKRRKTKWYWFTGVPTYYRVRRAQTVPSQQNKLKIHTESASDLGITKEEREDKQLTGRAIFAGFANFTTSHGIPHIYFSQGIIKKLVWSLLSVATFAFLIGHLRFVISSYISFAATTNIEMFEERSLVFPAVTICNNNAIKNSKIPKKLQSLLDMDQVMRMNGSDDRVWNMDTVIRITEELAMMATEEKIALGYTLEETVIFCSYNGINCNLTEFWQFYDSGYGNCYTFNSGKDTSLMVKHSYLAGPKYGLKLILNLGVYEYLSSETDEAGARIVIHDQNAMPFPEAVGISAAPGHTSDIAIRKSVVKRLSEPYGNCTTSDMNSENAYAVPFAVGYTEWACLRTCYQKHLVRMCKCFDPSIPYSNKSQVFADYEPVFMPCRMAIDNDQSCKHRVTTAFNTRQLKCEFCFQQCEQIKFDAYLSTSMFPAASYMNGFIEYFNMTHPSLYEVIKTQYPNLDSDPEKPITSNFLKLNIFYQDMSYSMYEQVPAYGGAQFVSDLGGTFGLWMGWSVITAFEFFGLLSDFCVYLFCFYSNRPITKERVVSNSNISPS
ncbi:FMRFamide-activated amiloride-sensitive sodium channel-like [Watersipora subatra]|uniref:FMRFamide-activated amiloride-sensitive sodium channel-like n=1 Tax=Watersipora subatra TaxID=2589382 RepID=UPI00355B489C